MITAIVVDDEPIARMDFVEMLKGFNIEVLGTGKDGFDAIDLCKQYDPDLVLMDIKMPTFDGLNSSKVILKDNPKTCIVLISAYNDTDFIEQAKEMGVAGYLVKPIEERTLKPALEIALAQNKRYNVAVDDIQNMKKQMENKKNVERAKLIISKKENISEGEAYSRIRKMSMDKRCSIVQMANTIIKLDDNRETVEKAKKLLRFKYKLNDAKAYDKIKDYSEKNNCSISEAASRIIRLMNN